MTDSLATPTFRDPPRATIVTGAAGWLGRVLLRRLAADDRRLRCLVAESADRDAVLAAAPGAEIVVGDVRDPTAIDALFDQLGDATVFHCASVIHPAGRVREFFDVNVGGTALVLDRAQRISAQRFVYVSSNSPFGFSRSNDTVFDEDTPYDPHLGYGRSKMEAEKLVATAAARGALDTVIVRAPWFYGPFQPVRQTSFFKSVKRGLFPQCGDGTNRRSMVYTENLADGLVRAERAEVARGRAYWIADARPYPMAEVLATVKEALAAEGIAVGDRQLKVPGAVSEFAGWADRLAQRAGRYVQPVHVLSEMNKTIACTIDRARADLGYEPQIELLEGMRRSVRWCLDNGIEL
jgi:nucleoside-diphosphate-sugar epimerase